MGIHKSRVPRAVQHPVRQVRPRRVLHSDIAPACNATIYCINMTLPKLTILGVYRPQISAGDFWSDGTGTLLRVVNRPPFFRSSTEARTREKIVTD